MPGETTLKIMIDAELKAQAEALYSQLGTTHICPTKCTGKSAAF